MSRLIFLWVSIAIALVFLVFPYDETKTIGFLWSDYRISVQQYVYYLVSEHLVIIMLAWYMLQRETKYRLALLTFFWIQVFRMADFIGGFCIVWYRWKGFPVSAISVSLLVFGLVIAWEYLWKDRQ